jgi:hypothetical protein
MRSMPARGRSVAGESAESPLKIRRTRTACDTMHTRLEGAPSGT